MTLAQSSAQRARGADGLRAAWLSDVGVMRDGNEDVVVCEPSVGLYAVIDGVGGEVAGERGAAETARVLIKRLQRDDDAPADRQMREAIALANNHLLKLAEEDASLRGMSCVVTAALVRGDEVIVGHVGDTRLYLVDERGMLKITADHSPVGQMEDMGELSELEARRHPRRNEIFRDVGSVWRSPDEQEFIDIYRFAWSPSSALLLCSDGLTDQVATSEILETIDDETDVDAVTRLVELANAAGGKDNVSVLLVAGPRFGMPLEAPAPATSEGEASPDGSAPSSKRRGTSEHPALRGNELQERGRNHDPSADPLRRAGAAKSRASRWAVAGLLVLVAALAGWWWLGAPGLPAGPKRQLEALTRRIGMGPAWTLTAGEGADHPRIQEAIDAARPGDSVLVQPGIYRERLTLRSGVAVRAQTSRAAVLVAGNDSTVDEAPAVLGRDVRDASLEGLVVVGADRLALVELEDGTSGAAGTAGSDSAAAPLNVGIRLIRSAVALRDLEVVGTTVAGIELLGGDQSVLEQSFLHDQSGSCVRLGSDAATGLTGNLFVRCGTAVVEGAAVPALDLRTAGSPQVRDNQFRESTVAVWTGSERRNEEMRLRNSYDGQPAIQVVAGPAVAAGDTVETTSSQQPSGDGG